MIRVVVAGSEGKMGAEVCSAITSAPDAELAGRADPTLGISLADALESAGNVDVVVDFTVPEAALDNIRLAASRGVHSVVGTTGFDLGELDSIKGANVIVAPNFAIGAILMMRFAEEAARLMPGAEIVELHHDAKLDRPSGTARLTAERMTEARGGAEVPVHSVRLPGLVAHQEVILGSEGETLTIRHDSIDRKCFMPGVLLAVRRVASLASSPLIGLEQLLGDS
ncbi:MAG: dihydrodipicolinate reductase C-terminal domain-containing protein [Actinomycetes bacterium]